MMNTQENNIEETEQDYSNGIVKILKLVDGTNLIGVCFFSEESDYILVGHPMAIHYSLDFANETTNIHLYPYLPVEITGDNAIEIKLDKIITIFNPNDRFIEEYFVFIKRIEEVITNLNESLEELEEVSNYTGIKH